MRIRTIFALLLSLLFISCAKEANILGVSPPSSLSNVRIEDRMGFFGGDAYLTGTIEYDDFLNLAEKLGMRNREDLLEYWPSALRAQNIDWWTVSSVNDENTFFSDSEDSTYLVMRYEDGSVFFIRHVY